MNDPWALKAADFVRQALDLPDDPYELAASVVPLKRELRNGISAIELDSSIGPTPFLIYHYLITGDRTQLDTDLETLERAAELGTPGPRVVAHAVAGDEAYILATTPGVQAAMSGDTGKPRREPPKSIERARTRLPDRLADKLRETNELAGIWLAAMDAARAETPGPLELTDQEAALALLALDEGSIGDLLRALNLLLATARQSAGGSAI